MSVSKEELARSVMIMAEMSEEITSQDNLATMEPVFMVQEKREIWDDISGEKTGVYHHNLQPFFTRKGAQRYIDENRHNLSEPRIFVESAYRNREWIAVRTFLRDCWNKGDE